MKKIFSILFAILYCQNIHTLPAGLFSKAVIAGTVVAAGVGIRHIKNQGSIPKEQDQKLIEQINVLENNEQVVKDNSIQQISQVEEKKLENTKLVHHDQEQKVINENTKYSDIVLYGIGVTIGLALVSGGIVFDQKYILQ